MPDEYIKKSDAVAAIRGLIEMSDADRVRATARISRLPAEDVGPVVRCKNCVYYLPGYDACGIFESVEDILPDHFCSRGITEEQWKKENDIPEGYEEE